MFYYAYPIIRSALRTIVMAIGLQVQARVSPPHSWRALLTKPARMHNPVRRVNAYL